jgi:hypothetical protein
MVKKPMTTMTVEMTMTVKVAMTMNEKPNAEIMSEEPRHCNMQKPRAKVK